jgi:conjugative transfer signal peptidase TraF
MRRPTALGLAFGGVALLGLSALPQGRPWLVWNASASAPIGLYRVVAGPVERGDWVLVRPPEDVVVLAAERGYLPLGVPLVKRVAARAGDAVCARMGVLFINGQEVARPLVRDRAGRPMPRWRGCRSLGAEEIFLLLPPPDSFHSRYFGPVPRTLVIGRLTPLWTS